MSDDSGRLIESNKALWDDWTTKGFSPGFYKLEHFRAGGEVLQGFEIDDLGDVTGKSLLHLQCHFGLDTLAWARRGARATGVDFSDESIAMARKLAGEVGLAETRFVASDVYGLPGVLEDSFDIVYTSFGVLAWLPDLDRWARVIEHFLAPGGTFYIAEYHPFPLVFEESRGIVDPKITNRYFPGDDPIVYTGEEVNEDFVVYGWPYTLGGVVSALAATGLRIEFLHELPFSESPHLEFVVQRADGSWGL
ncbi:MAG TPA: class I SAM-dependent methyltransferase, partial [Actinomycetota bacterium]